MRGGFRPLWHQRITGALVLLDARKGPLTRVEVETCLGVSPRCAQRILSDAGALQVGTSFQIPAAQFRRYLRALAADPATERDQVRRRRLAERLEDAHVHFRGQQVKIRPTIPAAVAGLDPRIHLRPGELRITFDGLEDLAARMMELGSLMARDPERIAALCGGHSDGLTME